MPDRIRLLLVDDQILSRGVLRSGLERERDLEIVAELNRSDDVVGAAKRHRANVALLDAAGPGNDSIKVTTTLRTSMPECRVVMLTTYGRPIHFRRGLEAGAKGIALKGSPAPQLAGWTMAPSKRPSLHGWRRARHGISGKPIACAMNSRRVG